MAGFLLAHDDCPTEQVEIYWGAWSVVCWCEQCKDLKTYEVVCPLGDRGVRAKLM
jgi:hypothetical protein